MEDEVEPGMQVLSDGEHAQQSPCELVLNKNGGVLFIRVAEEAWTKARPF